MLQTPNYTLYHGDCLAILPTLEPHSVDAIICDPPYGIDLQPQRKKTKAIAGDKRDEARALWLAFVPHIYRIAKPDTAHIICGVWSEVWAKEILEQYFTVKSCIVWRKNNFGIGYYTRPQHEFLWYCHKGKPAKPVKAQSDVWDVPRVYKRIHSCQKPVGLMERAINFVSQPDGVVLDCFMGVGSTGVAALNTGRKFIGIERDASYFDIAAQRLAAAQHTPQQLTMEAA